MINIERKDNKLYFNNIEIYGYIYMIKNNITNKVYIGQTVQLFNERYSGGDWSRHTGNIKLKRAVNKYGKDNFTVSVIDVAFSKAELNIKERTYIQCIYNSRKNGYNLTDGGEGSIGYTHSDDNKVKISNKSKEMWSNEEIRTRIVNSLKKRWEDDKYREKFSQKVVQLDLNKIYINEFSSIDEAEKNNNVENIPFCCRGVYKTAGGYIWLYKDDYEYLLNNGELNNYRKYLCSKYDKRYKNSNYIEVYQLDNNLNIIKLWEGIKVAEKELGISNITAVCKGRQKTSGGYIWCYESDYNDIKENNLTQSEFRVYMANKYGKQKYIPKENKKIIQLDLDFNTIKVWDRIVDIENQLNISNSNISAVCRGKRNRARNYYFMYLDDYNEIKDYKYSLEEVKQWLKEKYK